MRKFLLIGLLGYWVIGLFPPKVEANMQNSSYVVDQNQVDIEYSFKPTPTPIKQNPEQEKPLVSGKNFTVTTNASAGFQFSLSTDSLNFGELSATNPVTRLLNLGIDSLTNYQIFAAEDKPLMQDKITLPDTTCDSGACTEITPALWTSSLTYGFGYHTPDMTENIFAQFADLSKNEPLELITQDASKLQKEVLYKVNISGTQQPGGYSNVVTYLATPSF